MNHWAVFKRKFWYVKSAIDYFKQAKIDKLIDVHKIANENCFQSQNKKLLGRSINVEK